MRREPRQRTPRAQAVDLPGDVMAELAMAGESFSERAAPEGEERTAVQIGNNQVTLMESLTPAAMQRYFPELKEPGQPESALAYLRRTVRAAKRALRRQRGGGGFVNRWKEM